jgi:hypothetical protein
MTRLKTRMEMVYGMPTIAKAQPVQPDRLALQVQLVLQELRGQLAQPAQRVPQDLQDLLVPRDQPEQLALQVQRVPQELPEQRVPRALLVLQGFIVGTRMETV